jgi:hypothetical protein
LDKACVQGFPNVFSLRQFLHLILKPKRSTVQIVILPKVRTIILIALAAVLLIIGILALRPLFMPQPEITATGLPADAQAAVNAVTAFCTFDYTESSDLWATRVCAYASEAGCRAIQDYFAPAVQAMVQENAIQSGCTVEPVRLVADKGDVHIWQVAVSMDNPWPGLDAPVQDVFVEVEKVGVRWLMNRILFEQETEQLITPTP